MRRVLLMGLLALALVAPAHAAIGTADNVPAATLLIPYFEVDLGNPNGQTTLFGIQNTSATAILAHVTLWTDLGVPTFVFNVYLTGYDTQTVNVRDVFQGRLPQTASAGQDPGDIISNQGSQSQDINFASCGGILPPAMLSAEQIDDLARLHRGLSSSGVLGAVAASQCAARNSGDNVARGYITIDTVNNCTARRPSQLGYFVAGGQGDVTNQNVMFGDWFLIDPQNNFTSADLAVHIEASATDPRTDGAGDYTFYGRLPSVNGSGADNREPLPNSWAVPYMAERSSLRVWRDPGADVVGFPCSGALPAPFPLTNADAVAFDSEENPYDLTGSLFPYAYARTPVGPTGVPATPKQGWMYLNLDASAPSGPFGARRQSWVGAFHLGEFNGRFSWGLSGVQLGNPSAGSGQILVP